MTNAVPHTSLVIWRWKRFGVLSLSVIIALSACGSPANSTVNSPKAESVQKMVVERDTPAIGKDGALVEDVGIETLGGVFTALLKTGCQTPCKDSETFSTAQDNQIKFQVSLFRGKGKLVSETHSLGVCYVVSLPPAPRGMPQILVTVEAAEREIRMYALDNVTKKSLPIQCEGKPEN